MKGTDLRRKLIGALASGGLLVSSVAIAAPLNTNLVINPGFENVDINVLGELNSVQILDWTAGTKTGFAYSHDGSSNGMGDVIPDYANGGPLASGGHYYFASNATPNNVTQPGQFSQIVDVSTGPSAALIAAGRAVYKVGAFFSSFDAQGDTGNVLLEFLNNANVSISSGLVSGVNPATWSQNVRGGSIPVGTTTVRVSLYGTAAVAEPDVFIDNVDFQITNDILQPTLGITVDRDTGGITLINQTGGPVSFKSYSITSEFGSLEPANWLSIAENYDSDNPGPNQVDANHQWSELTDPAAHGDLSEADLQASTGSSIAHTRSVNLSAGNAWIRTPTEDLVFQYNSGTQLVQGFVNYIGHGGSAFSTGDLNTDGAVNTADWMIFRTNQQADFAGKSGAEAYRLGDLSGDMKNDHTDFVIFKTLYDAANGTGAFVAMLASVPEPSTSMLLWAAGLFVVPRLRRPGHRG